MRLRTVTSLNWLLGSLAIGVAALFPVADRLLSEDVSRAEAEAAVQRLAEAEKQIYPKNERFIFFTAQAQDTAQASKTLGVPIPSGDFVFDAFTDADNALVIRAFTSPAALRGGTLRPMLYRYVLRTPGADGAGEWAVLSGRSPGLQGLPASLAAMFH